MTLCDYSNNNSLSVSHVTLTKHLETEPKQSNYYKTAPKNLYFHLIIWMLHSNCLCWVHVAKIWQFSACFVSWWLVLRNVSACVMISMRCQAEWSCRCTKQNNKLSVFSAVSLRSGNRSVQTRARSEDFQVGALENLQDLERIDSNV